MGQAGRIVLHILATLLAVTLLPLAAADPAHGSPNAVRYAGLFDQLTILAIVIGIFVWGFIIVTLVKWRRNRPGEPPVDQGHRGNKQMEVLWTIIPVLIVIWIGFVSTQALIDVETPGREPDAVIDVVAQQWLWQFDYPNGWTDFTDMWIRQGATIEFNISSKDVQHALAVPGLGIMRDAYPGRMNEFWVRADELGTFEPWMADCGLLTEEVQQDEAGPNNTTTSATRQVASFTCEAPAGSNFTAFTDRDIGAYRLQCQQYCWGAHAEMVGKVIVYRDGLHPQGLVFGNFTRERASERPEADVYFELNLREEPGAHGVWSVDPEEIRVQAGQVVAIRVWNNETVVHNLKIGGAYDLRSDDVPPNGFGWMTFTADKTGSFPYWCDVPGHRQAGMEGQLIVA